MRRLSLVIALVSAPAALVSCSPGSDDQPAVSFGEEHELLSSYHLFKGELRNLQPADGVIPYVPVSPLFSDFARKERFIALPPGESIDFNGGEELWNFPEGTIIVKNFFFDLDRRDPDEGDFLIIETRLLVWEGGEWESRDYVWNEEQTEAELFKIGKRITLEFTDENGEQAEQVYEIPSTDHCKSCHERDDEQQLLGLVTPQANMLIERDGTMVNQLEWLADEGLFGDEGLGDVAQYDAMVDPADESQTLDDRARAYLHANCAHCHRPGGGAGVSGLRLSWWAEEGVNLGICKLPAAAGGGTGGREYDIVPGHPEKSIAIFRMESSDPDIKMPELPNRVINDEGVQLIRDWITELPPAECSDE